VAGPDVTDGAEAKPHRRSDLESPKARLNWHPTVQIAVNSGAIVDTWSSSVRVDTVMFPGSTRSGWIVPYHLSVRFYPRMVD
jgi:hypothetical protein